MLVRLNKESMKPETIISEKYLALPVSETLRGE